VAETRIYNESTHVEVSHPITTPKHIYKNDDNVSVNSEALINEPIKRLAKKAEMEKYDHGKYMELENDMLKTELRNLKNKYNTKKQELVEKCEGLERKNEYL